MEVDIKENKIGIDLGGTKILMLSNDKEYKTQTGILFTKKKLEEEILGFISKYNLKPDVIGIAVPGLVNNNEIVRCDVLPKLNGWKADEFCSQLPFTVKLFNDVQAALAEECYDYKKDFTGGVIMIGTAIGAALITNGNLLTGTNGYAGEFGYFPIVINGKIKILDEISGGSYLAKQLNMTSLEMYHSAIEGNEKVIEIIKKGGYYLGVAIAGLINLLNPDYISIGGGTAELPCFWDELVKGAKQNTIPLMWSDGIVKKVKSGKKIVALGAIRLS